jgi:hypothetical protein
MAQTTAVNWLLGFIEPSLTSEQKHFFSKVIEQAKAMEKEQIRMAFTDGHWDGQFKKLTSEEYYNEQYGK